MLVAAFAVAALISTVGLACGILMFWRLPVPSLKDSLEWKPSSLVSIIIPARNEENRIVSLLESLSRQQGISFETLVIDDDSEDRTSEVARSFNANVIRNTKPDDGWIGKSAACWTGVQAAKGDLLLFMDADTTFERSDSLLRCVNSYVKMGGTGILSLQPYHKIKQVYENASTIFNIIVMTGMNVFTPFGERLKSAGSFGPCILCNRADYDASGGHAAIRGAVMDDLALGEAFQQQGLPVHCFGGRGLIHFRMYPEGFHQLLEGWTKNFGTASKSTHPFVMILVNLWITGGFVSPALLILTSLFGSLFWIIIATVLYLFNVLKMAWLARRTGNFSWWIFPFYPLLLVFFTAVFMYSLYLTHVRKTVSWRGRKINV
ncbi:glycosyltransferase [Sporosarcina aquimarina]|uniref:4,4'-diaponeurosporenoate glycosyltransferase n=1 Tax=Sporosarcina aquimarina TaxID=114975 RepID=A0ABU4FZF1_9BACL|nr:glycosyltransferase family 2 protein [Sporosarcina aquimarina]MDW0110109.1 glycosyltransferase family 2 protein [Sporosarcina aquimarina]